MPHDLAVAERIAEGYVDIFPVQTSHRLEQRCSHPRLRCGTHRPRPVHLLILSACFVPGVYTLRLGAAGQQKTELQS
jgi:hypothetical protein